MARRWLLAGLLSALVCCGVQLRAVEIEDLKKEVARIRDEIAHQDDFKTSPISTVDNTVFDKYGANDKIKTRSGNLVVSGLVQIWYQHIEDDKHGIVRAAPGNNLVNFPFPGNTQPIAESSQGLDNDTYRVRRTELRFIMDINDNVSGYIMMDPSRQANVTFTPVPTNPNHDGSFNNPHLRDGTGQVLSNAVVPQLLQDAYVNFHDLKFLPRHDFQIGQFKPPSGEEAWRSSGLLDFVDRSMVTAVNNVRDIGVMAHGGYVDAIPDDPTSARFQYWIGLFNGPSGTVLTDPEIVEGGNRSDDNNDKDLCIRLLGQPVWDAKKWYGRLEVGTARTDGYRGKSGNASNPALQINGLNRERVAINRQAAWIWYRPGGPTKGWWLRGEWGSGRDNYNGRFPVTLLGLGTGLYTGDKAAQLSPQPVSPNGWFFSTGYKLAQTIWVPQLDKMKLLGKALKNSEIAFRYETYDNIAAENTARPDVKTSLFRTVAYTAGYNYYIDAYKTRLQANYLWVVDPNVPYIGLRPVHNNMFVLNFQVQY